MIDQIEFWVVLTRVSIGRDRDGRKPLEGMATCGSGSEPSENKAESGWTECGTGKKHFCKLQTAGYQPYEGAIEVCYEDLDGTLWAANSEYVSQVNYCPCCGFRAKVPAQEEDKPANEESEK